MPRRPPTPDKGTLDAATAGSGRGVHNRLPPNPYPLGRPAAGRLLVAVLVRRAPGTFRSPGSPAPGRTPGTYDPTVTSSSDPAHPGPVKPDRDAVADTVNRYTYALDERDWDLLDDVFTPDAVARYGAAAAPAVRGRAAIVAMIRSFLDRCGPSQHLLGNHVIDIDGDTADSVCKARVLHIGAGEHANITYECVGVYRDRLSRTAHGWRIAERTFVIDIELGDRAAVLGGPAW